MTTRLLSAMLLVNSAGFRRMASGLIGFSVCRGQGGSNRALDQLPALVVMIDPV